MASMETIVSCNSSCLISSGMAVISLDFSLVLIWPSTIPFSTAQALTMWIAPFSMALSWDALRVLPSMATWPMTDRMDWDQLRKASLNCRGSSMENTLPKVSWEGMPFGSLKNCSSHWYFDLPYCSTSPQFWAPQTRAQIVMVMISISWCLMLYFLGSSTFEKYVLIEKSYWSILNLLILLII